MLEPVGTKLTLTWIQNLGGMGRGPTLISSLKMKGFMKLIFY
jgi:hypothetical protein